MYCREAVDSYNRYKQRCNAFFMDLVSRLCFSGDTPPDEAVVKKLMGYVTRQPKLVERLERLRGAARQRTVTKKLTLFEDSIDPTPVVRSFLLQLLLRSELVHKL